MPRNRLVVILLLASAMFALHRASGSPSGKNRLQSFYIVRFFFSDYLPGWSDQFLEVTPSGDDVRVRVIRISQANDFCPGVIVRAAERVLPHTSVKKVARTDICAFTSAGVDAALKAAAPNYGADPSDSATETIVAQCGTTQKVFDFPYPVEVDLKVLRESNPEISDLWDTNYRVFRRTFGKDFSFNTATPEQEKRMEQLGTSLVPEMMSGKYQPAYAGSKCGNQDCDNYLAWELKGYTEAPQLKDPFVVTLRDAASLHFVKYVPPIMPRIAAIARIWGDVHLLILADPKTGTVTSAKILSGNAILARAAVTAAQSWQFDPRTLSGQPMGVALSFELKCS
ncbi:MAG: energy transducer TonB [Candidatus Acidiferrales bacterium]